MAKSFKKGKSVADFAAGLQKSHGPKAAAFGGLHKEGSVIPTGSLALDYELGTGGWTQGTCHAIFGPRDIGKSSMIGLNAVKNAQAMGFTPIWIALERIGGKRWQQWATENGVDVNNLLILYPDNGEEAMSFLIEASQTDAGLCVFDSLGALISDVEIGEDGKPRVGGQALLISWALKQVAPNAWDNDVAVLLLNQVRDVMSPMSFGAYKMPGGHALEHFCESIVQLRPGKERYMVKRSGTDIMAGRQIIAQIHRNKGTKGSGHKAIFDYFFMDTTEDDSIGVHSLGIDSFTDVINTAKRTGVITQAGAYYDLPNGKRIQGMAGVKEYLEKQPDVLAIIRSEVLDKMPKGDSGSARLQQVV